MRPKTRPIVIFLLMILGLVAVIAGRQWLQPKVAVPPADPAGDYLVWLKKSVTPPNGSNRVFASEQYLSLWIRLADGRAQITAKTEGLVLLGGQKLWRMEQTARDSLTCECPEMEPCKPVKPPAQCHSLAMRPLGGRAGSLSVLMPEECSDDEAVGDYQDKYEIEAVAGPYLFARRKSMTYQCGAHEGYAVSYAIWHADGHDVADLELVPSAKAGAEYQTALKQEEYEDGQELNFAALRAAYSRDGRLGLRLMYFFSVSGAESDVENFGTGGMTVFVQPNQTPVLLQPYSQTPPEIMALVKQQPGWNFVGWTPVAGTPEQQQQLLDTFRRTTASE